MIGHTVEVGTAVPADGMDERDGRILDLETKIAELRSDQAEITRMLSHTVARLTELSTEFHKTRPTVYNCPKCHRKVGPDDAACGMCGSRLR